MQDIVSYNPPQIVSVKDFKIDSDYVAWVSDIKHRYHSAQIKAAVKVNMEKLRLFLRLMLTQNCHKLWQF